MMQDRFHFGKVKNLASFLLISSFFFPFLVQASPSIRYLRGRLRSEKDAGLNGLLETHSSTTVTKAWNYCQDTYNCVSFGFQATARYPGANVTVAYYAVADWHISSHLVETEAFFVPDDSWHLYVNTTREQAMVATEVQQTLAKLKALDVHGVHQDKKPSPEKASSGRLRSRGATSHSDSEETVNRDRLLEAQEKAGWLLGLFGIAKYKHLRLALLPTLTRPLIQIASDNDEMDEIRTIALEIILALTDSYETPVILQGEYNLLTYLQAIIQPTSNNDGKEITWGVVNTMALDLISNMALHRTKSNPFVIPNELWDLLQHLAHMESGSAIGLQASLALIHFWGTSGIHKAIGIVDSIVPKSTLLTLLELLEATIDGDPVYGYDWDLMPGPLSAIQLLLTEVAVQSSSEADESLEETMVDTLLNAGLVDQLVRILDRAESLPSAATTLSTLEILQALRKLSPKAETMVAMVAATSIDTTRRRLQEYDTVKQVAQSLAREVATHKLHQGGGWMDKDDQEL